MNKSDYWYATPKDYWAAVRNTADTFLKETADIESLPTRPSTVLSEMVDDLVDRNWTDEDALVCLQYSDHPSMAVFSLGSGRPTSPNEPFNIKYYAGAAFSADLIQVLSELGTDLDADDETWERSNTKSKQGEDDEPNV